MSRFGEPINNKGQSIMKSIEIESHFRMGISKSLNLRTGCWGSALTFWQVKHLSTFSAIFFFHVIPPKIQPQIFVHLCPSWVH